MPRFSLRGRSFAAERRYALWRAGLQVRGRHLPYNFQQTGSCVGAGGGNMAKTAVCVEIALKGEHEQYRELWWPFTYGVSRKLAGMRGEGEGSFGSAWAKAATTAGFFELDPADDAGAVIDLPDFIDDGGWLVQPAKVELKWSAGERIGPEFYRLGLKHLFKTAAPVTSSTQAFDALSNGYPLTIASMFGIRAMTPRPQGNPPVRLAVWDGEWAHQMFIDEAWDHPTLGMIFRVGNNWGPDAHGTPTGEEPPGGFYVTDDTLDQILRTRDAECYAFSSFDGFPARRLNFSAF